MKIKKNIPNILTFFNILLGLLALIQTVKHNFIIVALLMLICVFLDFLDGFVARHLGLESEFGAELDSLSDIVSFGIVPAVFAYTLFPTIWILLLSMFLVFSGAFRLARFNVYRKKINGYIGMPITINGLIFPILYFLNIPITMFLTIMLISSLLMISNLKFKKVV